MHDVIRFPDATTIHATPELSQLGKNVPGVLNVAYDAQVPPRCHQLRNKKIRCENFVVLLFLLFSVKAECFCGYLVIIIVVVVIVVVFVVAIVFVVVIVVVVVSVVVVIVIVVVVVVVVVVVLS